MRTLTLHEETYVSGGFDNDEEMQEVLVTASRHQDSSLFDRVLGSIKDYLSDWLTSLHENTASIDVPPVPPEEEPCLDALLGKTGAGDLNKAWGDLFRTMSSADLNALADTINKMTSDFPTARTLIDNILFPEAKALLNTMASDIKNSAELSSNERIKYGQNFGDQLSWLALSYPDIVPWKAYMENFLKERNLGPRCGSGS